MKPFIEEKLLAINRAFYSHFAESFAITRVNPQPGYTRLLSYLPPSPERVLDVGCGNGRFGRFLKDHLSNFDYTGIDFSEDLLQRARCDVPGTYYRRDISHPGFLHGMGMFDVLVCVSTLQHIPDRQNRSRLILELGKHLTATGIIVLANWQFLDSARQRRKVEGWETIGLSSDDVEANDYLLNWQRNSDALRYVCMIDAHETAELAQEAGLVIKYQFRSDGKEGNLNLYSILSLSSSGPGD